MRLRLPELQDLKKTIRACARCPLRETATQPVPGLGQAGAKYMLIGEAPGRDEDKAGVPFVGAAGKKLNQLLELSKINVDDCFFTNVCRCRPPKNRTPRKPEVKACLSYLMDEIRLVQPEVIITLGATPLQVFDKAAKVSSLHGTMLEVDGLGARIMVQYHPAAALHAPRLWATLLEDWEWMPQEVAHDYKVTTKPPTGDFSLDVENDVNGKIGHWSVAYRNDDGELCIQPFFGPRPDIKFSAACGVMHNAKYDTRVLRGNKMNTLPNTHDTMIAAYCLGLGKVEPTDSEKAGSAMVGGLGLKYLARRHLGIAMKTWDEVHGKPELIPEYNAMDSVATYLLWEKWKGQLPKHYWAIDMPLLPVVMAIEDRGIQVDPDFLAKYAANLDVQLADIKLPFRPFATKEIADYVYGTLNIKPWKFTPGGQPSTEKEVLETIDDPTVKALLRYRELYSERNTGAKGYMRAVDQFGRIHTELKQTSTATGRLSSANPNLQNVVKDSDMRKLFVAPDGKRLIRMDYSQLELRVLAAITRDPTMLKAFENGEDIHQATADVLGVSRYDAKTNNFLTVYGGTPWKIAAEFHVSIDKAKEFQALYFARFPRIKQWMDEQRERARAERRVVNYFGRTRRLDAMFSDDWRVRQEGEREAINTPIQGAAAEVVKLAMIELHKRGAVMLLQVHDELLFEVDAGQAKEYAHWLSKFVPTITEINGMRFPVEVGVGGNWKEASK